MAFLFANPSRVLTFSSSVYWAQTAGTILKRFMQRKWSREMQWLVRAEQWQPKACKVKVDAVKLRQRLALTAADFNRTLSSMAALCSDLITHGPGPANKRKRGEASKEGVAEVSPFVCVCGWQPMESAPSLLTGSSVSMRMEAV
eukprot:scaffold85219_cov18-Tisochrysis_lutea.AAC.2